MPEAFGANESLPPTTLGGAIPILRVTNLDASVAYYVECLGFQVQWRANPGASVGRGRASLMLCE